MRCVALLFVVAALAACNRKSKDDATCGTVAARLFTLANDDLAKAKVEPAIRRAVADQLPAMRDALTGACTDSKWSAAARNCMANAADHVAFQACQQQLTDEQRRTLDQAARRETPSR